MSLETSTLIAMIAAFFGGFFAFSASKNKPKLAPIALAFAAVMAGFATFAAIKDGLSHGEGLEMLVIAWIAFASTVYISRVSPERDAAFRTLFTAAAAIGFIACFYFTISPVGMMVFWVAASVPLLIGGKTTPGEGVVSNRAYAIVEVASMVAFGMGTFVFGHNTLQGECSFVTAALLRLGVFPLHLGMVGYFEQSSIGNRLSYVFKALIAFTVCSMYLHPLLGETGLTIPLMDMFLVSAIFFAFVCVAETNFRRMLLFAVFSSMSIVVAVFAAAATEEGIQAAWILAVNMMVAACALFLCEDAIERRIGSVDSQSIQGLSASMPVLAGFSLIAFFELVNVPMSWGFRGGEMALSLLFHVSFYTGALSVFAWGLLTFALIRNFANLFWGPSKLKAIAEIDLNSRERWALLVLSLLIVLPIW